MSLDPEIVRAADLPAWCRLGLPLAWLAAGCTASWAAVRVALWKALLPLERAREASWVERARLAWGVRLVLPLASIGGPLVFSALAAVFHGPLHVPDAWTTAGLSYGAAFLGGQLAVAQRIGGVLGREVSVREWLRSLPSRWLLYFAPYVVAIPLVFAMPLAWNARAAWTLAAGALATLWLVRGGSLRLLHALGCLAPPTPALARVTAEAAAAEGIAPPPAFVLETAEANAFAHFRPRRVLVTRPLLERLDEEQLRAILQHEVGHLSEGAGSVAVLQVTGLTALLVPAMVPLAGSFGWIAGLPIVAGLVLGMAVSVRIRRRMELTADHAAHEHSEDTEPYARALEELHRANLTPVVLTQAQSVHPSLWDRMLAAGVTPDYPRPEPPPRDATLGARLWAVPFLLAPFLLAAAARMAAFPTGEGDAVRAHALLALTGGDPSAFEELARARLVEGEPDAAVAAALLSVSLVPRDAHRRVRLGGTLILAAREDAELEWASALAGATFASALDLRPGDHHEEALRRSIDGAIHLFRPEPTEAQRAVLARLAARARDEPPTAFLSGTLDALAALEARARKREGDERWLATAARLRRTLHLPRGR